MPYRGFAPGLWYYVLAYLIQGALLAYVNNFQKPYLISQGITPAQIGMLTSAMLLPFIAKILLGALSDRFPWGPMGRRKPYILLGLAICAASYFVLSNLGTPVVYSRFLAFSVLLTLGLALFDAATDGLALDSAPTESEEVTQASMISGRSLGYILFSYLFGYVAQRQGVDTIFFYLFLLTLVVFGISLFLRSEPPASPSGPGLSLRYLFSLSPFLFALVSVTLFVTSFGADGLITWFLRDSLHLDTVAIGAYGSCRGVGAVLGAVVGFLIPRFVTIPKAFLISLILLAVFSALIPTMAPQMPIWSLGIAWGGVKGFGETLFFGVLMRLSRGAWAATVFATFAMMCNIGTAIGEGVAPNLVARYGFSTTFVALGVWMAVPLLVSVLYFESLARTRAPSRDLAG